MNAETAYTVNRHGTPAADHLCAYCWPSLIRAAVWDAQGRACCQACIKTPARTPQVPRFVLRDVA